MKSKSPVIPGTTEGIVAPAKSEEEGRFRLFRIFEQNSGAPQTYPLRSCGNFFGCREVSGIIKIAGKIDAPDPKRLPAAFCAGGLALRHAFALAAFTEY